jgi:hypothetical protein
VLAKLNGEINKVLQHPELKSAFAKIGIAPRGTYASHEQMPSPLVHAVGNAAPDHHGDHSANIGDHGQDRERQQAHVDLAHGRFFHCAVHLFLLCFQL